ncbi:anti-sigma factor RsiW [Cryobacterium sp. MP_M5]|uniref:zf-HC2 domain-containing protein n=1 Tax=unclassified Cryobacterium TaxID=2649013 RepID=UPI0018C960E7|nr:MULTISPECIES: zf-HC2 domain-containing protein [unclassified Cryobacterium]MBG6057620.1 RNA polymerase sigma-70 factor (ECF subfamily) [Cryobacterium sp. MP_M3]MEC5175865.1 anti-sigma factor RsiW [Cryobacterium sp. MP_M5]
MTPPDAYADWDAAYVLGALSSDERHEFERHLAECADCARLVAELAALPGLLGSVPADEALALDRQAAEPHPDSAPRDADRAGGTGMSGLSGLSGLSGGSLPRLMDRVRRRRRRVRALVAGAVVAVAAASAAAALVLATVLPGAPGAPVAAPVASTAPGSAQPRAARTAMEQVVPSPLSASFVLTGESWGTRIASSCSYAQTDGGSGSAERAYSMYVTDTRGTATLVATWLAGPGTAIEAVGTTSVARRDIASVDIRLEPDGLVLLAGRPQS